jgi:hypothetical protein
MRTQKDRFAVPISRMNLDEPCVGCPRVEAHLTEPVTIEGLRPWGQVARRLAFLKSFYGRMFSQLRHGNLLLFRIRCIYIYIRKKKDLPSPRSTRHLDEQFSYLRPPGLTQVSSQSPLCAFPKGRGLLQFLSA